MGGGPGLWSLLPFCTIFGPFVGPSWTCLGYEELSCGLAPSAAAGSVRNRSQAPVEEAGGGSEALVNRNSLYRTGMLYITIAAAKAYV